MSTPPEIATESPKKKPGMSWSVRLLIAVVGIVAIVSGVKQIRHGVSEMTGSAGDWQRHSVAGLSVELPGAPAKEEVQPPAAAAKMVRLMEQQTVKANGAIIKITHVAYVESAKVSAEAEEEGGTEALKNSPGIENLKLSVTEAQVQNGPAKKMTADYTLPNFGPQHYEALYFSRGQDSWAVVVMGVPARVTAITERLLPSVQFSSQP